jgi:hypothetical protein
MGADALRSVRLLCMFVGVAMLAASCSSRKRDDATTARPAPAPPPPTPPGECAKDDDCGPYNCCFALQASSCVPRAAARCDKIAVQCDKYDGPRYECSCKERTCVGTLAAGSTPVAADAGAPEDTKPGWATGDLKQQAVLDVIIQHAPDVKACRNAAKKAVGNVVLHWTVLPSGAVERPTVAASSVAAPALSGCLAKKVAKWRFPKAKGKTQVTYGFQFRG